MSKHQQSHLIRCTGLKEQLSLSGSLLRRSTATLDLDLSPRRRFIVARKTVMVCDNCGAEVEDGKGAVQRVTFNDARRGAKQADLCDNCAGKAVGHQVARRGR